MDREGPISIFSTQEEKCTYKHTNLSSISFIISRIRLFGYICHFQQQHANSWYVGAMEGDRSKSKQRLAHTEYGVHCICCMTPFHACLYVCGYERAQRSPHREREVRYALTLSLSKQVIARIEGIEAISTQQGALLVRQGSGLPSFLSCHTQEGPVLDDQCSALLLEMTWEREVCTANRSTARPMPLPGQTGRARSIMPGRRHHSYRSKMIA